MNQNELIELAKHAGSIEYVRPLTLPEEPPVVISFRLSEKSLETFAKLVAEHEREACAKLFEEGDEMGEWYSYEVAKEIRAKGQTC